MTTYTITITRNEPHPKPGESVPNQSYRGGWQENEQRYPDMMQSTVLTAEITQEEYRARKRAILDVKE